MYPHDTVQPVVESLQRASLDCAHWPAAAALIGEVCGVVGHSLAVAEGTGDDARVHFAGFYRRGERRPDLEREYFERWYAHDERVPRLRQAPEAKLIHVPDLYSEAERKTSFVYNEALPRLESRNGLAVRLDLPNGMRVVWVLGNPAGSGVWQSGQIEVVRCLLPHIRQHVQVRQALAGAGGLNSATARLVDDSRTAVLCLDHDGRVLSANDHARDLLRRGDGLSDSGGPLAAAMPGDDRRLRELLGRALPSPSGESRRAGSMMLRRPGRARTLWLDVSPLPDRSGEFERQREAALVLAADPTSPPGIDPQRVSEVFGLTLAQGLVAALLAAGGTVRDISRITGYRENRVHRILKRACRNMKVPGTQELVARIMVHKIFVWR